MKALYVDHHNWLESWLRRQLGCAHQAADLSQDTFTQMLEASSAGRLPPLAEPRAYLTVVAKRVLYNFWRRRDLEQAYIEALATLGDGLVPSAEEHYAVMQALQQIDATLGGLPPKVRQVFLLSQLEGMTYSDISRTLGLPVISVRRAMARSIAACSASN